MRKRLQTWWESLFPPKPASVRLRELIHACGGDPDAPAVQEFLQQQENLNDPELLGVREGILAAFRG